MNNNKHMVGGIDAVLGELDEMLLRSSNQQQFVRIATARHKLLKVKDDLVWQPKAELPEAKPVPGTPNPKRRPDSRSVSCPTCNAKAGQGCFMMTNRGASGMPTDEPKVGYHVTRTRKSKGKR